MSLLTSIKETVAAFFQFALLLLGIAIGLAMFGGGCGFRVSGVAPDTVRVAAAPDEPDTVVSPRCAARLYGAEKAADLVWTSFGEARQRGLRPSPKCGGFYSDRSMWWYAGERLGLWGSADPWTPAGDWK